MPRTPAPLRLGATATIFALALVRAAPVSAQVLIQEVLYDGPGTDGDDVFTELVGEPGTDLAGWSLVGVNGGSGEPYRSVDLSGAVVPDDGVLVVATDDANDSLAAERDLIGAVDWQNGPDAVLLVDATGVVVDALQYGDAGAHNAGEGAPAPRAASGLSLSRDSLGTDTGDNGSDFTAGEPTPGVGPLADPDGGGGGGDGDIALINVSLPDTMAAGGDTLVVPVRLTDTTGLGLLATELFLTYDGDLLIPVDVRLADLVDTLHWNVATNHLEGQDTPIDTLRVAMATDADTLAGAGALVHARFVVADLRRPAASGLTIEHLALNDGLPADLEDGSVGLVGIDATMAVAPDPVYIHGSLAVTVVDADEDRDPGRLDTLRVRVSEGPEATAPAQAETVEAVETGLASGTFAGTIAVAYGEAVSANGIIETVPRHQIELCFDDSLDAAGATTVRCTTLAVPAHDGRLDATIVAEPGDTLWLRLTDADLNLRPDTVDSVSVAAVDTATADTQRVRLTEVGVSDSAFFGHVETISAAADSNALRLAVAERGLVRIVYLDATPTIGDTAVVAATTMVLPHFGDADANDQLQAFDAARVLGHALEAVLSPADSLAANVDSLAPFGSITPYDAALILQHRVGLRRRFPVQASDAANHPQPGSDGAADARPLAARTRERSLRLRSGPEGVAVWIDERAGILSGDLTFREDTAGGSELALDPDLRGFLLASRTLSPPSRSPGTGLLRVAIAGAVPASGPGELFQIHPRRDLGSGPPTLELVHARFNDGRITARVGAPDAGEPARPGTFVLHPNHPNPFNTATVIGFDLATQGYTEVDVVDVLGQRVRRLAAAYLAAGPGQVRWDGMSDDDRPVATGVYLVRLSAGGRSSTRCVVLLR